MIVENLEGSKQPEEMITSVALIILGIIFI